MVNTNVCSSFSFNHIVITLPQIKKHQSFKSTVSGSVSEPEGREEWVCGVGMFRPENPTTFRKNHMFLLVIIWSHVKESHLNSYYFSRWKSRNSFMAFIFVFEDNAALFCFIFWSLPQPLNVKTHFAKWNQFTTKIVLVLSGNRSRFPCPRKTINNGNWFTYNELPFYCRGILFFLCFVCKKGQMAFV